MNQRVTIFLKDVEPGLDGVQDFSHVTNIRVVEGVYLVQTQDGSTATFPAHNVLASFAIAEVEA